MDPVDPSAGLKIGLAFAPTDETIGPAEMAREVEARGFAALLVPEHTHLPADQSGRHPAGGVVPREYRRLYDPLLWLAAAAAATEELVLGTGVCLVAQHDPIVLAKQIATLDHLTDGRLLVGVGYGWNVQEVSNHGIRTSQRRALVRETCLMMQSLWTKEVASFDGELLSLRPSWSWPKPIQRPYPPLWLGSSAGPESFLHVTEFCDGWLMRYDARLAELDQLAVVAEAAGRDPGTIRLGVQRAEPDPQALERFTGWGIELVTFSVRPAPRDEVLRRLDELADVVALVA